MVSVDLSAMLCVRLLPYSGGELVVEFSSNGFYSTGVYTDITQVRTCVCVGGGN